MGATKYGKPRPTGNGVPVLIDGVRTPFVKSFGVFASCDSLELFSRAVDGLIRKLDIDPFELDEIIAGAVLPQLKNGNVARDAIINLGLPHHIVGHTLNKACTSSMQSIIEAVKTVRFGHADLILAGGVECLSDVPIAYSKQAQQFLLKMTKARFLREKLDALRDFNLKSWIPNPPSISEPMTGLSMGQHTELMAKINSISQEEQNKFALRSNQKAHRAKVAGILSEEIVPVWPSPDYKKCIADDNLIRENPSLEAMAKLKPAFDKKYGTITAATSSPLTDGAAVTLITDELRAKDLGLKPKAKIRDFCFVAVDPNDQLLIGPAIAIPLLLKRNNLSINDIDRFEIHEAFAAQVLSCIHSMNSKAFNEKYFGEAKPFGLIDADKLNVNGGAIAIGHPFGASGARLITSVSNELIRSDKNLGVVAICAAGAMAGALLIERLT